MPNKYMQYFVLFQNWLLERCSLIRTIAFPVPLFLLFSASLSVLLSEFFIDYSSEAIAAVKSELGWSLTQNRKHLGLYKVSMARSGVHVEMPNQSIIVLCLPPGKTVSIINIASKRICQLPLDNFEGQMVRHLAFGKGKLMSDVPILKTGQFIQKNIKADRYEIDNQRYKKYLAQAKESSFEPSLITEKLRLSALTDSPFSAAGALMTKLYGLPKLATIPLEMDYKDPDGGSHLVLDTLSISRKNVDRLMILPAGLKKATIDEVLLDGNESAVDILKY